MEHLYGIQTGCVGNMGHLYGIQTEYAFNINIFERLQQKQSTLYERLFAQLFRLINREGKYKKIFYNSCKFSKYFFNNLIIFHGGTLFRPVILQQKTPRIETDPGSHLYNYSLFILLL